MRYIILTIMTLSILFPGASAQNIKKVDLIIKNAKIYSLDPQNEIFQSMAILGGKIVALGTNEEIASEFTAASNVDAAGKPVYPGFIDAHSHFLGYAEGLQQADLTGTASFGEVLERMKKWSEVYPGEWLTGRGWDHNDWKEKKFPDRSELDAMFPERPVVLIRIDGHVVLANGAALKKAGIMSADGFLPGEVEMKGNRLTGILSENAADTMRGRIPSPDKETMIKLINDAEKNCFAAGLTTVNDAGTPKKDVLFLDSLQNAGKLKLRITVMLNPTQENINFFVKKDVFRKRNISASSIKLYADGSLGSRTALLKKPYSDDPSKTGILSTSVERINEICAIAKQYGYQVNTHAIGDSAVALVLDIYSKYLEPGNDLRWRIEHSQVVDTADLKLFGKLSVIPSVQATHATSDMYWAGDRLGKERVKHAYAYKDLLKQNGWIPNGTDFPIEKINPLYTFYAAVARKDLKGYPKEGFQKENALTREEALRSITIWAAKASFDERNRGSIEKGKDADFVMLDKDIMTIPEKDIPATAVLKTFIEGKEVYSKK